MKHKFFVKGMHCNSCVILTEAKIGELPHVEHVRADLSTLSIEVSGNFGEKKAEEVAEELTEVVRKHGYELLLEKEEKDNKWSDFKIAGPAAIGFIIFFIILQKLGIVNIAGSGEVTYGTAFLVGIIASLSTCMAVVGGLVLSVSAASAKDGKKARPQVMFHLGRIVSFFLLGGVIGALGAAFTLSAGAAFILGLLIALVMLILGINLLDVFPSAKKLQPAMPKWIAKKAYGATAPVLAGAATFFLPCGFTQAMQFYTLSTGSFMRGGLTMLFFALGTLPVLALISFGSFSIKDDKKRGIFFKTAGLVVIMFAIFNLINSLAALGIIPGIFSL